MKIYDAIVEAQNASRPAALATVIRTRGSTPRHEASKLLVFEDGSFIGTIGGGEMEARVLAEGRNVIRTGQAQIVRYTLADPGSGDPGVCGGEVEIFVEPILPSPRVAIVGAGHVGRALAHLAKWLGYRVAIIDDRPEMLTTEVIPDADLLLSGPLADSFAQVEIDSQTYVILVTRGYPLDVQALPVLLASPAPYIGVIGSQRRWLITLAELRRNGIAEEQLARVHSPVGLELNAETPEEIAVSIMAEVIMIRRGGSGQPMSAVESWKKVRD